jgi:hypothetical protein
LCCTEKKGSALLPPPPPPQRNVTGVLSPDMLIGILHADLGRRETLQYDGPHQLFLVEVWDFVERKFLWKWSDSRGGPTIWPFRSSLLTPPDFLFRESHEGCCLFPLLSTTMLETAGRVRVAEATNRLSCIQMCNLNLNKDLHMPCHSLCPHC